MSTITPHPFHVRTLPWILMLAGLLGRLLGDDADPGQVQDLGQAILEIHARPDRDYRICCEYASETKFLETPVRKPLEARTLPGVTAWLTEARLPFVRRGNTVIVQDPLLKTLGDSPMDFQRADWKAEGTLRQIRTQIVEAFQVIIQSPVDFPLIDSSGKERRFDLSLEGTIHMRDIFVELSEKYDVEWLIETTPRSRLAKLPNLPPNAHVVDLPGIQLVIMR